MGKRRSFDKVAVVDLEATCWATKEEQGDQPSEIIEVGICLLDVDSLQIQRKRSYIVRPRYSKVSQFCTDLTGYTWDDVKCGMPFPDACNKVAKEMGTRNRVWASWGDYDRKHFLRECKARNASYPFSDTHFNVKTLFMLTYGEKKNVGLGKAINMIGAEFIGTPHKGEDDAYNTAVVLKHLLALGRASDT